LTEKAFFGQSQRQRTGNCENVSRPYFWTVFQNPGKY